MKYMIKARLEVDGRIDKHDVIGAIFGQTESLLGSEFNLEDLQSKDKIGRVHVDIRYQGTKTVGTIQVPSNLDRVETAILAAMLETVDKIGPYNARIIVEEIKDLRTEKLKKIIERSREILAKMKSEEPDIKEIVREVQQVEAERKQVKVIEYGPEKLPAGPDIDRSDTIIIVEGRADVINLLKYGYSNVIALEGAREKVPRTIAELAKKKKTILFVDGDRGGDLILKTILSQIDVDYVARAPQGMEVEHLTGREIAKALSQMVPAKTVKRQLGLIEEKEEEPVAEATAEEAKVKREVEEPQKAVEEHQVALAIPKNIIDEIPKLKGTLEAVLYDKEWNEIERVKVRDLYTKIQESEPGKIYAVLFDGIITQRLLDVAAERGIALLIGARVGSKITGRPSNVRFMTFSDLS